MIDPAGWDGLTLEFMAGDISSADDGEMMQSRAS
jgi:hypothetical protein